ncbi:PCI domain protein (macronuclear) [Tetrahymena thermophila SB210]|uniref:PCI domain protein n=1 Tax=Tetrahymena thermophila (strain SB210) TaxID=312017 RepID=I7LTA2_TETTS|nr:PCI domain protein [Tetrahymena thermophila SB210]EAR84879.3 PCI domain protein [Tetrahymena thermophila SB210]|eukprot:XP_001032542.3 PCI domain protein [Tetrahymena thermophila SB210]
MRRKFIYIIQFVITYIYNVVGDDNTFTFDPTSYQVTVPDLAVSVATTLDKNYMYVASGAYGVYTYDISDLQNIKLMYNFDLQGDTDRARRVCLFQNDQALIVAYELGGLVIYNISNKQTIPSIQVQIQSLYANTINVYQDTILFATQTQLYFLKKNENYAINQPIPIGTFIRNIRVYTIRGKPYAYLTLGQQGLVAIDIQSQAIVQQYSISKSETFDMAVDSQGLYAFAALTIYGVDMFDISQLGIGTNPNIQKPISQIIQNNNFYYSIFIIGNHMYLSSYGKGVQIYNMIYQPTFNLQLIQEIILVGDTTTIYTDINETELFSTKNNVVHINQRTSPLLQNIDLMPNLQNTHQQIRYAIDNSYLNVAWDSYLYKNHFLIVPYAHLYIIDITDFNSFVNNSQSLKFTPTQEQPQSSTKCDMSKEIIGSDPGITNTIDGIAVDEVNNLLFLGRNKAGMLIYDIIYVSNPESVTLQLKNSMTQTNFEVNDIFLYTVEKQITIFCALGNFGSSILTYSINSNSFGSDIKNFPLKDDFQSSRIVKVLSVQDKYLFAGARRYGILVYDLKKGSQDPIYKIRTAGGEDFEFSQDMKYIYVADFLNGFSIISIQFDQQNNLINTPTILSRVLLDGQAIMVQSLIDQRYILVGSTGNKLISLIDVFNKYNPTLVQTMSPQNEVMQSFVLRKTDQGYFIVMPTTRGLRIYNMKRPFDLFYEIMDVNTQIKQSYQTSLLVGENLKLKLSPINLQMDQVYQLSSNLYLIQNLIIQSIPNYISFNPIVNEINLTLNKDNMGVMVMVAQFLFQISEKTFSDAGFTKNALGILSDAQQRGFLDSKNYPTDMIPSLRLWTSVSAERYVENGKSISDVKYQIESIFNSKIVYIPIRLNVMNSITFNNQNQDNTNSLILSTLSNTVRITITNLDKTVGQFVNKKYDQIQTDISSDQQRISLNGDPTQVSNALSQLVFSSPLLNGINIVNAQLQASKLTILIEDSINAPIQNEYQFRDVKFLVYNTQPQIINPIQVQFEQSFSSGVIYIETDFIFTLNQQTFNDTESLVYEAYLLSGNDEILLTNKDSSSWIHFDNSTLKFTGFAGYSKLGSKAYIKVKVNDGYYSTDDIFIIKIYGIPFEIVFNRFIAAVSGLSGLFVVWKMRGLIHMILCKRRIRYSTEIVKIGEEYRKQIPVVIPYIDRCAEFISIFLKYIEARKKQELLKPKKTLFCIKRYKHPLEYFVEEKQLNHFTDESAQGQSQSYNIINMEKAIELMLEFTNTIKSEDRIVPKKWFKSKSHISQKILSALLNYKYMTEFDKKTFEVFKTLKKKSILRRKYKSERYQYFSSLDWYLEFVKININEEDIYNKENEVRLPEVSVNFSKITKIYNQTQYNNQSEFDNKMYEIDQQSFIEEDFSSQLSLKIPGCNDHLLVENLKNYSLGIVRQLGFFEALIQSTRGCSVHVDPSTINIIKAMKKTISQGFVRKVKEFISMDYDDIELQLNRKLPNWLTCEWQNGSIYLKGTPEKKDMRNYQIRLEDISQFILMNYKLLIIDGDKQQTQLLQPHIKQEMQDHLSFDDNEGVETLNVMIKKQKQMEMLKSQKTKQKKLMDLEQTNLQSKQENQVISQDNNNNTNNGKQSKESNSNQNQNNQGDNTNFFLPITKDEQTKSLRGQNSDEKVLDQQNVLIQIEEQEQ